jgi:DNA-binding response OmpR family regulator
VIADRSATGDCDARRVWALPVSYGEGPGQAPCRVLIVDDDEPVRDFLDIVLRREGYDVATAEDGLQALEMLGQFIPDLIVLDLMMPQLDGWGVLDHLRGGDRLKIIVVSALVDEGVKSRARQAGAHAVLQKPFSFISFLELCSFLLMGRCAQGRS